MYQKVIGIISIASICIFTLQKGIDINISDKLGNTPIAYAAMNGHERYRRSKFDKLFHLGSIYCLQPNKSLFSCTFMLMQRNANINIMTYEELKTDLESGQGGTGKETRKKYMPELMWNPAKRLKDERRIVPLFQVSFKCYVLPGNLYG